MPTNKKSWVNIIRNIYSRTQLLALITLIGEALFIFFWFNNEPDSENGVSKLSILLAALSFLIISLLSIVYLELKENNTVLEPTGETEGKSPDFLENLIEGALEAICLAVSLPQNAIDLGLRVFIFKKENDDLVCRYAWASQTTEEVVGKLRFRISDQSSREIAVVQSAMNRSIEKRAILPLTDELKNSGQIQGKVDKDLKYVIATPIYKEIDNNNNGLPLWGIVDFDTTTEFGKKILQEKTSEAALFKLAALLSKLFELEEGKEMTK